MKDRNICKFTIEASVSTMLNIHNFIYETNPEIMKSKQLLICNRAILVNQGKGTFYFNKNAVPFQQGSLVFGFSDEVFEANCNELCEYMYISFDGSRADDLFNRFKINKFNRSFSNFDGLLPFWHNSLSRADQSNIDIISESILLHTFSRLSEASTEQKSVINEILELTEENFTDPDLSLSVISKKLAYNPKYISHLFSEKMGMGYSEYLRTVRIKHAISLFDYGIDSVKNVALLSGFTDPLYFSTVFKKAIGISPKEYKTRLSKGN